MSQNLYHDLAEGKAISDPHRDSFAREFMRGPWPWVFGVSVVALILAGTAREVFIVIPRDRAALERGTTPPKRLGDWL